MNQLPFISVAIPAHNEEKYIEGCLKSLKAQNYPHECFEIIVVVSTASTDKTAEICKKYGVKIVFEKPGIGLARYRGFEVAKGEILAATDADTIVPLNWLEVIAKDFEDKGLVALTGPVLPEIGAGLKERFAFFIATNLYKFLGKIDGRAYLSGMNFAVRKKPYKDCGEFKKDIKSGEDTELTYRIGKEGKTLFDPNLLVFTSTRRLKEGYLHSFLRYSLNFLYLKIGKEPPGFKHYR